MRNMATLDGTQEVLTALLRIQGGEFEEPFQVWIEETPAAYLVHVQGEVDALSAPRLRAYLEKAEGAGRHIIVDLSAVTFIDLNGFRLLEACHQRCRDRGRRLVVLAPTRMPRRIMDIVEFTREIPVALSVQEAEDLLSS